MPKFDNVQKLLNHIQAKIENALEIEVLEAIKETQTDMIQEYVYDAYTPKQYIRRGPDNGGYGDPNNIHGFVENGVLRVRNLTPPNPNYRTKIKPSAYVAPAIESGKMYTWYSPGARPAIAKTVEELKMTKSHMKALKNGLIRQNINVR